MSKSHASYNQFLSVQHTQDLGYCMITLATTFVAIRFGIRAWKRKFWLAEDITVAAAWACCIAMDIGYILVTPAVARIAAVSTGKAPPYAGIVDDANFLVHIFFPNGLLFWIVLWLVKLSLLLQIRRLIDRQPSLNKIWWAIVGFAGVVFVGCVVTEFTSCRNMHDWFTFQQCSTARDARASEISLFFAFAVDIITDLMIMIFPLRILWKLQFNLVRKLSIMAIFGVGIICICTSIVRVVNISSSSGSNQPSPGWLVAWDMIEASIAIVVSCLPTFGLLFPSSSKTGKNSNSNNYFSSSRSGQRSRSRHGLQGDDYGLSSRQDASSHGLGMLGNRGMMGGNIGMNETVIESERDNSVERLHRGGGAGGKEGGGGYGGDGVMVTTTMEQDDPPPSVKDVDLEEGSSKHSWWQEHSSREDIEGKVEHMV